MSTTTTAIAVVGPPCSPIKTTIHIGPNSNAEHVESLSGDLADYRKGMAELKEVVDELRRLENDRETLRRVHVYTKILAELNELWWPQLPQHVILAFVLAGRIDLPSTLASWWLQWNEFSPLTFPLPPSLCHFGPVKLNTRCRFIFDCSTSRESSLSKAIGEAWDLLPDTIRQLMLFAWAAAQSVRIECNEAVHPNMGGSTAKDILSHDFHDTSENLHDEASSIVDYLFT